MNCQALTIYAHSVEGAPESQWEPWPDHSLGVGALAGILAGSFARELGEASGLLHDVGKLRSAFQRYLRGGPPAEHSICGALVALERYPGVIGRILAYVIAGHHGGLPDGGNGPGGLDLRLMEANHLRAEIEIPDNLLLPEIPPPSFRCPRGQVPYALGFLVRMVFSALADADYLGTERFYDPEESAARGRIAGIPLDALAARLDARLLEIARTTRSATAVTERRAAVLARCRAMAAEAPGVFSLTVPTGGGKTLSSLAFALEHARRHGLRRVVYVIPYTSIIEQTADVFRAAFGDLADAVVEHHSAAPVPAEGEDVIGPKRLRLATENWDAPVIVTTAVQFFESLHANRPSRCRKLHNLAESVVILDEVQALPMHHLDPCLAVLGELAERYRTSVVLCSATVPDLRRREGLAYGFADVREIVDDVPGLFGALARVRTEHAGSLDEDAVAKRLIGHSQVLCIVDARRVAADIHARVARDRPDGALHLSAAMCPAHRRAVLAEVKTRLRDGQPCRLVSTTVIEAGVDVDFPVVYRAAAGVDSLAQAAGRCNRNGMLPELGQFIVFDGDWELYLPDQKLRRSLARPIIAAGDPLRLETVATWFEVLLAAQRTARDRCAVLARMDERGRQMNWPFRSLWEGDGEYPPFRIIDEESVPVLVPWPEVTEALVADIEECARQQRPVPLATLRAAQQVSVAVYPGQFAALDRAGAIVRVGPDARFFALARPELYDAAVGLVGEAGERRPEDNIM